jgi:regulator of sigma E protease
VTTILIFIAVLALLVFVHEFGHFTVAKWFGMRVDEFGLGFPPRAASFKPENSETTYTLNWLPLGGFVKIFGENGQTNDDQDDPHHGRSFQDKPWYAQVAVLVAGVLMNMFLAFLLLSLSYMVGTLALSDSEAGEVTDTGVIITQVLPDSPAEMAGLEPGDTISRIGLAGGSSTATVTPAVVQQTVEQATGSAVFFVLKKSDSATSSATATPAITSSGRRQVGIAMAEAGTLKLAFFPAVAEGARATVSLTEQTVAGFYNLLSDAIAGGGESLSQVAGPVGIADLVGDAADRGLAALFSFMALISINLAVLNLLPFPALDGGRIVFSIIEAIRGKQIPPKIATYVNGLGMILLLILMVLVTYQDIVRLI